MHKLNHKKTHLNLGSKIISLLPRIYNVNCGEDCIEMKQTSKTFKWDS